MALEVRVQNQNVEQALKILRRRTAKEGVFRELNRRVAHLKPSQKKKLKRADAAARRAKDAKRRVRAQDKDRWWIRK